MTAPPHTAVAAILTIGGLVAGCHRHQTENQVYQPQAWQGTVDPSLPEPTQAKQGALIRLFTAIQEVGVDKVPEQDRNLRFEESPEQFFPDDTVELFRWNWDGPPQEDEFPVVLILRKDEPGFPQVETHRTYVVLRAGRQFTIRRGR